MVPADFTYSENIDIFTRPLWDPKQVNFNYESDFKASLLNFPSGGYNDDSLQFDDNSDVDNDHYTVRDSFDDDSFDNVKVLVLDVVDKTHTAFDLSPRASEYKDTH